MSKILFSFIFMIVMSFSLFAEDGCRVRKYNFNDEYNPKNGFYIEKNNNKNVAFYDINILPSGLIDMKKPLDSYWHLLAEDGRRSEITFIERRLAFGVRNIQEIDKGKHYSARVASMDRDIQVKHYDDCSWVEIMINGSMARLERIMLELKGPVAFSTLIYMDIFGQDLATGKEVVERWYYDKEKRKRAELERAENNKNIQIQ